MKQFIILLVIIITLFSTSLLAEEIKTGKSSTNLIEAAFIQNKIDVNNWAKFTCLALYNHEELPAIYSSGITDRSGTMALKLLSDRWHLLSETTKSELSEFGFNILGIKDRPANLDTLIDTEHFRVHYTITQGNENAVSPFDYNNNGVPDYIDKITSAFENTWATEIDSFLFYQPPNDSLNGGNSKYDVYITKFSGSDYGLTYGEQYTYDNPNTIEIEHNAATSYIVMRNEYNDFSAGETGSINVTAAHEFFHAIQYGYDQKEKAWLMESTAAWIEDEVYDDVNDNRQYLSDIFDSPWIPLDATNAESSQHWYGTWIFFRYLSEHEGGTFVINNIWEKSIDYNSALGDFSWLAVKDGLTGVGAILKDAIADFWVSLLLKDNSGYGFEEAEYYSPVHISYSFWNNSSNSNYYNFNQKRKAARYFRFSPALNFGGDDKITIKFVPTNSSAKLGIIFIKKAGSIYSIDKYLPSSGTVTYTVEHSSNFESINAITFSSDTTTQGYKIQVTTSAQLSRLTDNWNFYAGFMNSNQHYFYPTYSTYLDKNGNTKVKTYLNNFDLNNTSVLTYFNGNYQILAGSKSSDDLLLVGDNTYGGHNSNYNVIITNDTSHQYSHFENIWSPIVGNNEAVFAGSKLTYNPYSRDNAIWKINLTNGSTDLAYQYDDQNEYCSDIKGKINNFIFQKITYSTPLKIEIIKHSTNGNSTLLTAIDGQGTRINATSYYDDTFAWIQYVDSIGGQQLKIKDVFFNSIDFEDDESDGNKIDYISLKTSFPGVIWAKFWGSTYNPHFWVYFFDGTTTHLARTTDQFIMQNWSDSKRLNIDNYGAAFLLVSPAQAHKIHRGILH